MTETGVVEETKVSVSIAQPSVSAIVVEDSVNAIITKDKLSIDLISYDVLLGTGQVLEDDEVYDVETDFSTPGIYYIGQAPVGSLTSDAVWRIRRVTETPTGTSIDWASGTSEFVHVWDDRLTITYGP